MKKYLFIIAALFFGTQLQAQFVYKIKADSVKIYNDNCNVELILENSTKDTSGFLFNKGKGRTEFRRILKKVNDSSYLVGNDTLRVSDGQSYTQAALLTDSSFVLRRSNGTADTIALTFIERIPHIQSILPIDANAPARMFRDSAGKFNFVSSYIHHWNPGVAIQRYIRNDGTPTGANQPLVSLQAFSYDGGPNAYGTNVPVNGPEVPNAIILMSTSELQSPTSKGGNITFRTGNRGLATQSPRMRINDLGQVLVGTVTEDANTNVKLYTAGSVRVRDTAHITSIASSGGLSTHYFAPDGSIQPIPTLERVPHIDSSIYPITTVAPSPRFFADSAGKLNFTSSNVNFWGTTILRFYTNNRVNFSPTTAGQGAMSFQAYSYDGSSVTGSGVPNAAILGGTAELQSPTNKGGFLRFFTGVRGAGAHAIRMHINDLGQVLINGTVEDANTNVKLYTAGSVRVRDTAHITSIASSGGLSTQYYAPDGSIQSLPTVGSGSGTSQWTQSGQYLFPAIANSNISLPHNFAKLTMSSFLIKAYAGAVITDTAGGLVRIGNQNPSYTNGTYIEMGSIATERFINFVTGQNSGSQARAQLDSGGFFPAANGVYDLGTSFRPVHGALKFRKGLFTDTLSTSGLLLASDAAISSNFVAGGSVTASSFITSPSDIRKKNVLNRWESKDGIDYLKYTVTKDQTHAIHYGFEAQQVLKVLPNAVRTFADSSMPDGKSYGVDEQMVIVYKMMLIESRVKQAEDENRALKKELDELKKRKAAESKNNR